MNTLKELIDAIIILGQIILVIRFVVCCIKESNYESNEIMNFKKQKKQAIIALILIVMVYDIPKLIESYFGAL